jgi:hypothetical protein
MIRVWIVSLIALFSAAELFQWLSQASIPLPLVVAGGVVLAIASNLDKLESLPFRPEYEPAKLDADTQNEGLIPPVQTPKSEAAPQPSISFEIRKPFQPDD